MTDIAWQALKWVGTAVLIGTPAFALMKGCIYGEFRFFERRFDLAEDPEDFKFALGFTALFLILEIWFLF